MLKHVSRRNRNVSWWGTASLCTCSRVWDWMLFTWWGVSPKSMWLFMQWGANGHCWEGVVESALSSGHGSLYPRSSYGITTWFDKFRTIEIQTLQTLVHLIDKDMIFLIFFFCFQTERVDIYLVCKEGVHLFVHGTTVAITQRSKASLLWLTWYLSVLHGCPKRYYLE